jgi:methyl-accepting chemotaxis protein
MKDAMVRRQKIRVKTLMLLSIFLTVTVGFTATIGFMMWQWMAQQEVLAKKHIRQIAEVQSLQVSKQMDSAWLPPGIWATAPWRCAMRASPIARA